MWGYGERRIPIMMCNVELLAWTSISCKLNIGIPTILRHGMETTSRKKQNFRARVSTPLASDALKTLEQ